ncbi:tryptophan--tRNA ligase, partial [Kineococcus sp. TBRC 1896]
PLENARRRSADLLAEVHADPGRFRVVTGDRPTGPLHLGHLLGTLVNRVALQRDGVEVFVVIADHQVTTDRDDPGDVRGAVRDLLLDNLAAGLEPGPAERGGAAVFVHSAVPALHQVFVLLLGLVTEAELRRNPTVKAEAAAARARPGGHRAVSGLLLTYPVHQAADVLSCRGTLVPVGQDQLPHLEIARTVARRCNERFGGGGPVLVEPEPLLSPVPLLAGTDGRKMSKSAGNSIALRASEDETARLVRSARTDAERRITFEPDRRPEVAALLVTAAACSGATPEAVAEEVGDGGAVRLKAVVTEAVNEHLRPLRRRRRELEGADDHLRSVLAAGAERANEAAGGTVARVLEAMGLGV